MDQVKIGKFISDERKAKGYTQKQLSETRHHRCYFVVESSSTYRFRMASQHIVRS